MSSSTSASEPGAARANGDGAAAAGPARPLRYLIVLAATVLALQTQVWLPNVWVDPLWYFSGNHAPGPSFALSTREAKLHRLGRAAPGAVDCLIGGSSRALTLDTTAFQRHRCANLAVEAATLPESLAMLERAAETVPSPMLVIQPVDNIDLEEEKCLPGLARAEAQRAERLPGWWERYAALDVLRYSRRMALGHVRGIGYDAQWRPVLDPFAPRTPRWKDFAAALGRVAPSRDRYTDACIEQLPRLREVFPAARRIGYTSPIAADIAVRMELEGELDRYLAGVHAASRHFDAFHDFSAPSALTLDPTSTWDGSHYHPRISPRVAAVLEEGGGVDALRVDALSFDAYRAEYRRRVEDLIAQLDTLAADAKTAGGAAGGAP